MCGDFLTPVSGVNFYLVVVVSGIVTIFYTSVGGIRTVVWTDLVQTVFIVSGVIVLTVKGTLDVGGISVVLERNRIYNRLDPPRFDLNLNELYTFWNVIIGYTFFFFVQACFNQGNVQRCVSVPTLKDARNCTLLNWLGVEILTGLSLYNGLLVFATFYNCDPLTSKKIHSRDQLLPLLTMKIFKDIPGLSGLFVAAVVSAAISSLSTILNSLAAVILQDLYKPFICKDITDNTGRLVMKTSVVVLGTIMTGLVFIAVEMGSMVQVSQSLVSATNGPILAVFTIGIFLPCIKSKAVIISCVISLIVSSWMSLGALLSMWSGKILRETKPLLTDGCEYNITVRNVNSNTNEHVFFLYKVSYVWYTFTGFIFTIVLASILNIFMVKNDISKMNRDLLSPLIHMFLPKDTTVTPATNIPLLGELTETAKIET